MRHLQFKMWGIYSWCIASNKYLNAHERVEVFKRNNTDSTKIDSIANNANTKTICEMYLKLTIKKIGQRRWRRSAVFIVNFEYALRIILVLPLWLLVTLYKNSIRRYKTKYGFKVEGKWIHRNSVRVIPIPSQNLFVQRLPNLGFFPTLRKNFLVATTKKWMLKQPDGPLSIWPSKDYVSMLMLMIK